MRVITPEPPNPPTGHELAVTAFFWPAREAAITPATARPRQLLCNFIEETAPGCLIEAVGPSATFQYLRGTKLANCLYKAVAREFQEPRGLAVTFAWSDSFVSP